MHTYLQEKCQLVQISVFRMATNHTYLSIWMKKKSRDFIAQGKSRKVKIIIIRIHEPVE